MEHLGAVSGSNQTAFEESDVMAQLLGDYSFSGEHDHELMNLGMQPMFWPDDDHELNLYSYFWSQESCLVSDDNVALSAHQFEEQSKSFNVKRKFDTATTTTTMIEEIPSENYKKKPRVATKKVQRNAKTIQTKKRESNAAAMNGLNAGYCSSEDDSNASTQELHASSGSKGNAAVNMNAQVRATRGSATDPQSLYARKRRERINERLRTLQNLVPNGTKVDISTMLEEAVQYVKFMQLQIKLLSSDELWMYAPIAYNGVNIGLDLNISPPKQ